VVKVKKNTNKKKTNDLYVLVFGIAYKPPSDPNTLAILGGSTRKDSFATKQLGNW